MRGKLDRIRRNILSAWGGEKEQPRPKLCPSCGTLVGAGATRCHQCGASMTFSLAAASKSLERLLPSQSPATYGVLTLSCLLFAVSLLETIRESGFAAPTGGLAGIFDFGAVSGAVLQRLGASLPWPYEISEPWRLVTAVFLHGSVLHILFNMWVLMDIGPQIEELYGSARFLFLYVICGIGGYIVSSAMLRLSVGGSGALLGLIGVLLALTMGRRSAGMQMLRSRVIGWLIYIFVLGIFWRGVDTWAHLGGLATGFLLGKVMVDRPPASPEERRRAYALGWAAALVVAASFAMIILGNMRGGQS